VKLQLHPRNAAAGAGVLALVASLAACGSDNNSSSSASGGSPSASSTPSAASGKPVCADGTLTGQGSSAQNTALTKFVKDYQTACGDKTTVNYTANGSGPGVTAFTGKQADWAGSDYPLNADQQKAADARCTGGKAISVGTIPGAIAVMYNVPGLDSLNLSAATLGKIFDNKITNWNDPAIATDNGGKAGPNLPIQAFHRGDGSGTSYNFSNYLNKTAPDAFAYPANKQFPGQGGQGVNGSKALATSVASAAGGIGYAEVSYATANKLKTANIGNAAGKFVPLTIPNAAAFIAKAKVDDSNGNLVFNFDYTVAADNAYPAVLVTYEIVCASGNDSAKLPELKGFLGYLAGDTAQSQLPDSGYVSLAKDQQTKVLAAFAGLS
jgi:phosphate transport system substrate-binding protein